MAEPERYRRISSWRDSRRASFRLYGPAQRRVLRRVLTLLAVLVAAVVVWSIFTGPLLPHQRLVLLLFLVAVGLWVTEAIPAFAVGLLIIGYLVFALGTDLLLEQPFDVSPYVDTWSSDVIWLMLGGFFLAEGLGRTGLDRAVLQRALRPARGEPRRVLLAIMLASAGLSMFISNTSTTAIMVAAVTPLVSGWGSEERFSRALLLGIPLAASVGGMGTIIGSAPNAIAAGVAEGFDTPIDFVEWMAFGLPTAVGLVLLGWWFLDRRYPATCASVELDLLSGEPPELDSRRDRLTVIAVTGITIALWLTTPLHGIPVAAVSLLPIVALTVTQVVGAAQVRTLPWDTLMLIAGGLSLGLAVVDTGLADHFVDRIAFVADLGSSVVALLLLALVTVTLSNFMSNTAAVSVLLPVAVALLPGYELQVSLVLGLSASCALMLPVSTPPNAIAYSTGALDSRDFRPSGLLVALAGPLLVVLWVVALTTLLH